LPTSISSKTRQARHVERNIQARSAATVAVDSQ
jgi:hypothetical protein